MAVDKPATSASALIDSLENELCAHILRELPRDANGAVGSMDSRSLLHVYGGWKLRRVDSRERVVHRSRELRAAQFPEAQATVIESIAGAITRGEDITPHLSTRTRHAYSPGERPHQPSTREDRDLLLADWGIHHLHLATAPHPTISGFTARTADVLFAAFRGDDAFLIGVYPHPQKQNWAAKAILEICVRNWPHAGIFQRIESAIGLSHPEPSDADRLTLRNAGVNTAYEIDGHVYLPLGQPSTAPL
jgi:hypothetical protein